MSLNNIDTIIGFALVMLLLSLQITVAVQIVVFIFGLRGKNLRWGLTRLFQQFDADLAIGQHAATLADRVLTHPALTTTGRMQTSAIRIQELVKVLRTVARSEKAPAAGGTSTPVEDPLPTTLLDALSGGSGMTPRTAGLTQSIVDAVTPLVREEGARAVEEAVHRALTTKDRLEEEVEAWFDTVMDRVSERFVLWTRWLTVGLALLFVVWFRVDSVALFRQIAGSSEIRAHLVAQVDATLAVAGTAVKEPIGGRITGTEGVNRAAATVDDPELAEVLAGVPQGLRTPDEGEAWLRRAVPEAQREAALAAYEAQIAAALETHLQGLGATLTRSTEALERTELKILTGSHPFTGPLRRMEAPGMVLSWVFLSLGAPFWFNALRQLANLKPIIAGKVERESKGGG